MTKVFSESLISEMKVSGEKSNNVLCYMEGPCLQFGSVNRNNRIYSRKLVEDRIINNPTIIEVLKNKSMLGEGGHPENRVDISYPEVGISCEKLWIPEGDGNMLYGRFAILDTPTGRILETLAKYGTKLGISARAVADSVQKDGHEVILENSYDLITFDAVPEPGFKCARLEKVESVSKPVSKMTTNELKESSAALKSFQNPVFESRIRKLDSEISKRENKANVSAILESIDRLSNAVDKSIKRITKKKYESSLKSLIKEAKVIIKESNVQLKKMKESKNNNNKIKSIKCEDININKFNVENRIDDVIDTTNLFRRDNTLNLEKMCSQFRRKSYE